MELIGSLLQKNRAVDEQTLDAALAFQKKEDAEGKDHTRLGDCLIRYFNIDEEPVYRALALQCSMPFIPEIDSVIDRNLLQELSFDLFKNTNCLPLEQKDSILKAVVSDPLDLAGILSIQAACCLVIEASLTTPSGMNACRQSLFEGSSFFKQSAGKISREHEKQAHADDSMSIEEIKKRTESEPVVKMATLIFDEALMLNASDIHIEPTEYNANVRYRIDGMLTQHMETARGHVCPAHLPDQNHGRS